MSEVSAFWNDRTLYAGPFVAAVSGKQGYSECEARGAATYSIYSARSSLTEIATPAERSRNDLNEGSHCEFEACGLAMTWMKAAIASSKRAVSQ